MITFLLMQFTALRILDLSCNELHQIEGLEKNRVKSIQLRSVSCLMSLVLLVFAYVCRISVNSSSMETKLHHLKDWKSGYNTCTAMPVLQIMIIFFLQFIRALPPPTTT